MIDNANHSDLAKVRESAEFVANSAFRILRLNLLIIGVYLTVGGYLIHLNPELQIAIAESYYFVGSFVLLVMSIAAGFFTYESAGRLAAINMYDEPQEVYNRYASTSRLVFNLRYSMLLCLLSGLSFATGIADGFLPTGIPILSVWRVAFAIIFVTTIPIALVYSGLQITRRLRQIYQNMRG